MAKDWLAGFPSDGRDTGPDSKVGNAYYLYLLKIPKK